MFRTSAMVFPLKCHLERLSVITRTMADLARDINIGKEVHLDLDRAVALAVVAPDRP